MRGVCLSIGRTDGILKRPGPPGGVEIVAHGLFDLVHHTMIEDAGVPDWWPGFCGSLDVVLGLWVIGLSRSGVYSERLPDEGCDRTVANNSGTLRCACLV